MDARNKFEQELERLFNELAESVLGLSDREISEEVAAKGVNPSEEAARIRAQVRDALKRTRQQKLVAAQQEYRRQIAAMDQKQYDIPQEPAKRRELLMAALARRPDMKAALTAQFRGFTDLSDTDVETALKHLAYLGILNEH